jgi:hypothetical protein
MSDGSFAGHSDVEAGLEHSRIDGANDLHSRQECCIWDSGVRGDDAPIGKTDDMLKRTGIAT